MNNFYEFKEDDAYRFAEERGAKTFRSGDELLFHTCPYCHGNSKDKKTFSINLKTGQFNCFRASCGAHGNMIRLAQDFGFSLGKEVDEYINPRSYRKLKNVRPETKEAAIKYLESRGVSEKTGRKYNIVTKDNGRTLAFPFIDENGIMTMIKYRNIYFDKSKGGSKEWCEPGCKPILFGMNHCNFDNKILVITEGQLDSLSLSDAGIENAVSVPNGAKGFTWTPHCWNFLIKFEELIVFGDYENEHISLLDEMRIRFRGCVKHVRPEDYKGCKDANEILQKYGKKQLVEAVRNAIPVKNPRIIRMADVESVDLMEKEQFSSGISWLDQKLGGFYFGQLAILTGERGEGKSTLASQFATFAVKEGHSVFIYSGEMDADQVRGWFELQAAGSGNIKKFETDNRGYFYKVDLNAKPKIEDWYRDYVFMYNNRIVEEDCQEEKLMKTLEYAIQQYGCRVIIIDNLMSAISDDLSADMYRQQSAFVREAAAMAKRFDVMIFLVAHPRKTNGDRITNDSISGSGNITNLADIVLQYGQSKDVDDPGARTLTILKNRLTGEIDREGVQMCFDKPSKRISDKDSFDWALGWENIDGFVNLPDDWDPVFD